MEFFLLFALLLLPVVTPQNPIPGLRGSKTDSRNLECERLTTESGHERYPGAVPSSRPREDYIDRSVLVCRERLMDEGVRAPRDEAILSSLEARASEIAVSALAARPEGSASSTWLVEVYDPSPEVAVKMAFATKNALVRRGLSVSDRTPVLAAGDVDVITRMAPSDAYPTACRRYHELGTLGPDDTLLAVVTRDVRETDLHAGVCAQGRWRWLR